MPAWSLDYIYYRKITIILQLCCQTGVCAHTRIDCSLTNNFKTLQTAHNKFTINNVNNEQTATRSTLHLPSHYKNRSTNTTNIYTKELLLALYILVIQQLTGSATFLQEKSLGVRKNHLHWKLVD